MQNRNTFKGYPFYELLLSQQWSEYYFTICQAQTISLKRNGKLGSQTKERQKVAFNIIDPKCSDSLQSKKRFILVYANFYPNFLHCSMKTNNGMETFEQWQYDRG